MGTNYGYLDVFNKSSSSFSQVIHKRMVFFNQTLSLTLIFYCYIYFNVQQLSITYMYPHTNQVF